MWLSGGRPSRTISSVPHDLPTRGSRPLRSASYRRLEDGSIGGCGLAKHRRVIGSGRCAQPSNLRQFPSETTSTAPSTTLIAVSSSIAYEGQSSVAAHFSAFAIVLLGSVGLSRCG